MGRVIANAKIEGLELSCEKGVLSFNMNFSFGFYQGTGGYCTYNPNHKDGPDVTGKLLFNLMTVFEVERLDQIKGYARIEHEDDSFNAKIVKIGHIVEDKWIDLRNGFEVVENG